MNLVRSTWVELSANFRRSVFAKRLRQFVSLAILGLSCTFAGTGESDLPKGAIARLGSGFYYSGTCTPWDTYAVSGDGKHIATASRDSACSNQPIHVWENTGRLAARLRRRGKPVRNLAFAPDGRLVGAVSDSGIELWRIPEKKRIWKLDGRFHTLDFAPDGSSFAALDEAGVIRSWALGEEPLLRFEEVDLTPSFIVYMADSSSLAAVTSSSVVFLETKTGIVIEEVEVEDLFPTGVSRLSGAWGSQLAVLARTEILVVDRVEGRVTRRIPHGRDCDRLVGAFEEGYLVCLDSGMLPLWDLRSGKRLDPLIQETRPVNLRHLQGAALGASTLYVRALAVNERRPVVFEVLPKHQVDTLAAERLLDADLSSDGSFAALAYPLEVVVLDVSARQENQNTLRSPCPDRRLR